MKTKITIFKLFLTLAAVVMFFSCDNPVSLGTRLDLEGPLVNITSPSPNKSVPSQFQLEGDIEDYSGVESMLVTVVMNDYAFPRQWRYIRGAWEISENNGQSWQPFSGAKWDGTLKAAKWVINVDMSINGVSRDGEYTFYVQAWDKGQVTDDNSFKAIVLVIDHDPPKVDISNPYIYRGINAYANPENALYPLHNFGDDRDDVWQEPANLGKFITQEFELKWQIEDSYNIWSIDIRFYPFDTEIDNDPVTPLPGGAYIYKYYKNLPPPPPYINPQDYIKPNGSVWVPDLTSPAGVYDGVIKDEFDTYGGEILNPITQKTTVKIIAVCYDAAGNPNQEKTLGYFIYWPKANTPWIVFTEGLKSPDDEDFYGTGGAYGKPVGTEIVGSIDNDVVMVYPGRSVKATAYQAHGVKEVKYSLYKLDTTGNILNKDKEHIEDKSVPNTSYSGTYTSIFPWEIKSPQYTGYYLIHARAYGSHSSQNVSSQEYIILFRVQDITFPDFPESPLPEASKPLFEDIKNNKITIRGTVADATAVDSLCMVWINPQDPGYAAMSQLRYFREKDYDGWKTALALSPGGTAQGLHDPEVSHPDFPNRVWRLNLTPIGVDIETNRRLFRYEQEIDLSLFNIGIGENDQPLRSQIFLLRAENPDKKGTVITYAPKGDTEAPKVSITNVVIAGSQNLTCEPNKFVVIQPFKNGDRITINGEWNEDSVEFLDADVYFLPNFNISVNKIPAAKPALSYTTLSKGTWKTEITVGLGGFTEKNLKDNLAIEVSVSDIGKNKFNISKSWLIQSDILRLMRITAVDSARNLDGTEKQIADGTYTTGQKIDIVLEFSKAVNLAYNLSDTVGDTDTSRPQLILNSGARAYYKKGQTNQNSRQYFEYTVAAGNTTNGDYLNVTGLYHNGTTYTTTTPYTGASASYPFAWYKVENENREEVRLTMQPSKTGNQEGAFYVRTLPTTTSSSNTDYQFTLTAAKRLVIDTAAPTVTGYTINTPMGDYDTPNNISVTVNFNKPVTTKATPYLTLGVTNGGNTTVSTDASVTVSNTSSTGSITFTYTIKANDTTNGNAVAIQGFSPAGSITDLAGNAFTGTILSTLTGIYIDTLPLTVTPTLKLLTASNTSSTVQNTVSGTPVEGSSSGGANKTLATLYNQNLWLAIETSVTSAHKLASLEYSFDNGNTWITSSAGNNIPFALTYVSGSYQVKARQKDRVGHISSESGAISFSWDRGDIISSIGSSSSNGTYTNNDTRKDSVNIIVRFRKQVKFTAAPTITLNVTPATVTATATYTPNTLTSELSFPYIVGAGHTTSSQRLSVSAFNISGTATDDTNVTVNSYLTVLPAGQLLQNTKDIYIQTGALTRSGITFSGSGTQTEGYFNNTALEITFSSNIIKGDGKISVIQEATNYRLPAVLTESQFSKYSSIAGVNTYYTKGSNGYIYTSGTDRKVDTSAKYILRYDVDPATITPNASGSALQVLAEAFRQAEKLEFSINASNVKVSENKLTVELTGTNALQVPGANYQVTYPKGFVQDNLEAPCPAETNLSVALGGVAKPFIRINKRQDKITTKPGTASQPALVAVQPFLADVKMDCRTPSTTIYYFTTSATTNVSGLNWSYNANPASNGPEDLTNPALPGRPSDPETTTTSRQTYSAAFTIGTDNEYQGLQWYVRARATTGSGGWSVDSEEMAFKTVITYVIVGMADGDNGVYPRAGDQIWIRGGDAVGLSSVPGFPINWDVDEFERCKTEKKRAGIRLFTNTAVPTTGGNTDFRNSTWKFITWEINVDTYFDIILGRDRTSDTDFDPLSSANEAWQYGPRQFAYQRAGWTSYKEQFRALPGKHRWLISNNPSGANTKGTLNFSGTFGARPEYKLANITYPQP